MTTMVVKVEGKDIQEAWSNLLAVVCYACECRQRQEGRWPVMVLTDEGKITATDPEGKEGLIPK